MIGPSEAVPPGFTTFTRSASPPDQCIGQLMALQFGGAATSPVTAMEVIVNSDSAQDNLGTVEFPGGTLNPSFTGQWTSKPRVNVHSVQIFIVFASGSVQEVIFFLPAFP